jgi:hypothetical protein
MGLAPSCKLAGTETLRMRDRGLTLMASWKSMAVDTVHWQLLPTRSAREGTQTQLFDTSVRVASEHTRHSEGRSGKQKIRGASHTWQTKSMQIITKTPLNHISGRHRFSGGHKFQRTRRTQQTQISTDTELASSLEAGM